ncbi:hypothetical protein B9G55_01880 [Saccharibacillus sp. O16]|nr:hypothetical protein B9G55_01880 [Saccharibacillus sp. O16]
MFARQVEVHADRVLRLGFLHLGSWPDAQDVCQDVLLKLFAKQPVFHDAEHEKAWIIRVTINACRDLRRSFWKKRWVLVEEMPQPQLSPAGRDVLSDVLALPRKYRMVIHLHYYEGYSTAEIAKILQLNENTVRTQLKRGRERLKRHLEGGMDSDEQ